MSDTNERTAEAILDFTLSAGRTPTTRELADKLGLKRSAAHSRINSLRTIGYLRNDPAGLVALGHKAQRDLARFTLGIAV